MTATVADLARELVGHPKWEWRDGMLALSEALPFRVTEITTEEGQILLLEGDPDCFINWSTAKTYASVWPDLTDAATAGCLLAMVHELMADLEITTPASTPGWSIVWDFTYPAWEPRYPNKAGDGATLGEACARALLALWNQEQE